MTTDLINAEISTFSLILFDEYHFISFLLFCCDRYIAEYIYTHAYFRSGSPIDGAAHRILHDQPIAVDDCDLPLKLPEMTNFQPVSVDSSYSILFYSHFALMVDVLFNVFHHIQI